MPYKKIIAIGIASLAIIEVAICYMISIVAVLLAIVEGFVGNWLWALVWCPLYAVGFYGLARGIPWFVNRMVQAVSE